MRRDLQLAAGIKSTTSSVSEISEFKQRFIQQNYPGRGVLATETGNLGDGKFHLLALTILTIGAWYWCWPSLMFNRLKPAPCKHSRGFQNCQLQLYYDWWHDMIWYRFQLCSFCVTTKSSTLWQTSKTSWTAAAFAKFTIWSASWETRARWGRFWQLFEGCVVACFHHVRWCDNIYMIEKVGR